MGVNLYREESTFKFWMDRLDFVAREHLGRSIVGLIYHEKKKSDNFTNILYSHPALFMVQYSLAQMLMDTGISPDVLVGASLGEYVALAVAEVTPAKELLKVLMRQATVIKEKCSPGKMLTILEDPGLYKENEILRDHSTLVGINTGQHFVISGFQENIDRIQSWLKKNGYLSQELPVSYGFHSDNIDPAFEPSESVLQIPHMTRPHIDIISCLTGEKLQSFPENYFSKIARKPINFSKALSALTKERTCDYNIIDLGSSGTYANLIRQNNVFNDKSVIYHIMTPFGNELKNFQKIRDKLKTIPSKSRKKGKIMKAYIFPGQGSQSKGMGRELFTHYRKHLREADEILGYSLEELCLVNPDQKLNKTEFTQPALFVVNALSYLKTLESVQAPPDFVAGHSLGEYNALFAAKVIDFSTGLRLVQKRGELMASAKDGGMAAIIGMDEQAIRSILDENNLGNVAIANLNSPSQIVIAGDKLQIAAAASLFEHNASIQLFILNVSGAFHSKLMESSYTRFNHYLEKFHFSPPEIPVISNVTARPYLDNSVQELLARQITHPVLWMDSVRYMWGKGVENFKEIGPGNVLTRIVKTIQKETTPLVETNEREKWLTTKNNNKQVTLSSASLGCNQFKRDYNLKYAYVTGGMANGIASKELVIKIGLAGMLGYLGTASLPLDEVEKSILFIRSSLDNDQAYGMNLLPGTNEDELVSLFLKHHVANIEAAGYVQITPALVRFKLNGLSRNPDGITISTNRIMAKLSRPEVASVFLSPAPASVVKKLLKQGEVTKEQADLCTNLPMANDICVEADSGGHTDMGVLSALFPAITSQRNEAMERYHYIQKIRIGAAGGIGTPEGAASSFILGADFILTGSINQCTVEARTSNLAKDMLQDINVQDTTYAPSCEMFEIGSKMQVVKRGVFFPARANKLYELYHNYNSLDEIDKKTKCQLEDRYFQHSFENIFNSCKKELSEEEIHRAESSPKHKMAMIFKWYLNHTRKLALEGDVANKVDFQIYCGPALGAFNQWVKGTEMENWRNRQVDKIATRLMDATAELLTTRFIDLLQNNVTECD